MQLLGLLSPARGLTHGHLAVRLFYNAQVKTWDVVIIGGGIIGLSLSIALRKRGATVLIVERGEPGREASHAAGGMLVDCPLETPVALQSLATASARLYPEFAYEIEVESGMKVDLRDFGSILSLSADHSERNEEFAASHSLPAPLSEFEPALTLAGTAIYLKERSVDPRALSAAAWKTAKHRGVDFATGDRVEGISLSHGKVMSVHRTKIGYHTSKVVNCAGAWSGQISCGKNVSLHPTRPVKGQMLCLAMPTRALLKHVVRTPEVYLIPRSDGRLLV